MIIPEYVSLIRQSDFKDNTIFILSASVISRFNHGGVISVRKNQRILNQKQFDTVMHIYFVDEDLFDYSKEYFKTHTDATHAFNLQVSPNNLLVVEMGSLQEYSSGNLRMTRDEYIEKRERMNQAC